MSCRKEVVEGSKFEIQGKVATVVVKSGLNISFKYEGSEEVLTWKYSKLRKLGKKVK